MVRQHRASLSDRGQRGAVTVEREETDEGVVFGYVGGRAIGCGDGGIEPLMQTGEPGRG